MKKQDKTIKGSVLITHPDTMTQSDIPVIGEPIKKMNDPMVSIVTPTWDNQDSLINTCIPAVRKQTYKYIEHIIVNDGIDFGLREKLDDLYYFDNYIELGRNWDIFLNEQDHRIAKRVGVYMAKGKYILFLGDDETLEEYDIERLVNIAEMANKIDAIASYNEKLLYHAEKIGKEI